MLLNKRFVCLLIDSDIDSRFKDKLKEKLINGPSGRSFEEVFLSEEDFLANLKNARTV